MTTLVMDHYVKLNLLYRMSPKMQTDTLALTISIASFFAVIVGPIVTNIIAAQQAAAERRANARKDYIQHLIGILNALIRVRSQLQFLQGVSNSPLFHDETEAVKLVRERETAYGEAYALMLCIGENKVQSIARQVMLGQFKPAENSNEKLDAIDQAIARTGELINENMKQASRGFMERILVRLRIIR